MAMAMTARDVNVDGANGTTFDHQLQLSAGYAFASGFTLDVGVLMQGEPNVDFNSTGGDLSNDPTFQANLKQEEANAEDDIKGFTVYPVLALGVSYRF